MTQPPAATDYPASAYASLSDLMVAVGVSDSSQAMLLELALTSASAAIASYCDRDFSPPTGTTELRLFAWPDGSPVNGRIVLEIDDLADATDLALAVDDGTGTYPTTLTPASDLWPLNAQTRGEPFTAISFRQALLAPGDILGIRSPRWGWPAIPPAVRQATLIQASRLFKRKDSPFGIAGSPVEGNVVRLLSRLDPDVEQLLRGRFQRYPVLVL